MNLKIWGLIDASLPETRAGLLYETAKNSSWPVTGLENKGPLKVLNGTKLILEDHGNN